MSELKRRNLGIILAAIGLIAIAAGIVLKRLFAMGQYLFILHVVGGPMLVLGLCLLFLSKETE